MVTHSLYYSLFSGLTIGLGSLLAYLFSVNRNVISFLFGLSSGMMLFLSYFSLLPTAVTYGGLSSVFIGMICAIVIMLLIHSIPTGKKHSDGANPQLERVGFFFIFAVIAHHIPEGIAIGVGFETEHHIGLLLVAVLSIHNLPEGMALALPLISAGRSPFFVIGWSLICGLAFPIGTWLGITSLNHSVKVLSISLTFAAATMIWIIVDQVFPQAFHFNRWLSMVGLILGGVMIYIIH